MTIILSPTDAAITPTNENEYPDPVYEADEGAEEYLHYKGRLLRCPACQQPVPENAHYEGLFQIKEDDTREELQWAWEQSCSGDEGR